MVLGLVVAVLARAVFRFLGLPGTSGSRERRAPRVAVFDTAFLLLPFSLSILALPPFLRLRAGAFQRLRLPVLRLACLGLLRPILRLAGFVLLRLGLAILRLMSLALLRLNCPLLRLPCLALLWNRRFLRLATLALLRLGLPILSLTTLALLRLSCPTLFWLLACLSLFFFLFVLFVSGA